MMTMLEKIAQALADADDDGVGSMALHESHARIVVEAMREPSDSMFRAAEKAIDTMSSASDASQYWHAMIDAILNETGDKS